MKESIQQAGREVSIVIYDAPLPPKYFRFSKKFIRTLFVTVPLLLGLLLLGLFLWGVFTRLEEAPRPSFPNVLSEQDSKVLVLEAEVKALQESNTHLTEKLASQPSAPTAEDPFLLA